MLKEKVDSAAGESTCGIETNGPFAQYFDFIFNLFLLKIEMLFVGLRYRSVLSVIHTFSRDLKIRRMDIF